MLDGRESPTSIERLVGSPAVRSTYASLLGHLGILVILALFVIPVEKSRRPQPIETIAKHRHQLLVAALAVATDAVAAAR